MNVSVIRTDKDVTPVEVLVCQSGARLLKPISCAEKRQAVLRAWMNSLNQLPVPVAIPVKDTGPTLLPVEVTVPARGVTIITRGGYGKQQSAVHVSLRRSAQFENGFYTQRDLRNRGARGWGKEESWKRSRCGKQYEVHL